MGFVKIKKFILDELQKEYEIDGQIDIDNLNFVEEGYVTSLGLIQFVVALEEQYGITFTDVEVSSEDFRIVGKLVSLIEQKVKAKP